MEFWNSLKESSQAALSVVKNDLSEFTSTVQNETATLFAENHDNCENVHDGKDDIREETGDEGGHKQVENTTSNSENTNNSDTSFLSLNSIGSSLGTLGDSIYKTAQSVVESLDDAIVEDDESKDNDLAVIPKLTVEERIRSIQVDRNTYARPVNPKFQEKFNDFVKTFKFDIGKAKAESQEMLQNEEILAIYHELVPAEVEEEVFWNRYFFWKKEIQETVYEEMNSSTRNENKMNKDNMMKTNENNNVDIVEKSFTNSNMPTRNQEGEEDKLPKWEDMENENDSNDDETNTNDDDNNKSLESSTLITDENSKTLDDVQRNAIEYGNESDNEKNLPNVQIPIQEIKSSSSNDSWTMVGNDSNIKANSSVAATFNAEENDDDDWDEWE